MGFFVCGGKSEHDVPTRKTVDEKKKRMKGVRSALARFGRAIGLLKRKQLPRCVDQTNSLPELVRVDQEPEIAKPQLAPFTMSHTQPLKPVEHTDLEAESTLISMCRKLDVDVSFHQLFEEDKRVISQKISFTLAYKTLEMMKKLSFEHDCTWKYKTVISPEALFYEHSCPQLYRMCRHARAHRKRRNQNKFDNCVVVSSNQVFHGLPPQEMQIISEIDTTARQKHHSKSSSQIGFLHSTLHQNHNVY